MNILCIMFPKSSLCIQITFICRKALVTEHLGDTLVIPLETCIMVWCKLNPATNKQFLTFLLSLLGIDLFWSVLLKLYGLSLQPLQWDFLSKCLCYMITRNLIFVWSNVHLTTVVNMYSNSLKWLSSLSKVHNLSHLK